MNTVNVVAVKALTEEAKFSFAKDKRLLMASKDSIFTPVARRNLTFSKL